MHRIDNSSAVAVKPAPPGSHTPGYFDPGDLMAERDATILDCFWANTVQEELAAIVQQGAGVGLDLSNDNQVLAAIRSLIAAIPHDYWAYANTSSSTNFVVPAGVPRSTSSCGAAVRVAMRRMAPSAAVAAVRAPMRAGASRSRPASLSL